MKQLGRLPVVLVLFTLLPIHAALPPVVLDALTLNNCLPPSALAVDDDGNRFIAVTFTNAAYVGGGWLGIVQGTGTRDVAVAKYDPEGHLLWWRRGSGPGREEIAGVATDPEGDVYITGRFEGTVSFDQSTLVSRGLSDIFVVKYTRDGRLEWAKHIGGSGQDYTTGITRDPGGVRICGAVGNHALLYADPVHFSLNEYIMVDPRVSQPDGAQAFVATVSPQGQIWDARTWPSSGREVARSVAVDADRTMAVVLDNTLDSRVSLVIARPGQQEIRVVAGTYCDPRAVCITGGAVYLAGRMHGSEMRIAELTVPRRASTSSGGFVVKLQFDGSGVWGRDFASGSWAHLNSVASDPTGGLLLAGLCSDDLFVGEAQVPALGVPGGRSVVAHLSEDGELNWAKLMGEGAYNSPIAAAVDGQGGISVLGAFEDSLQLDDIRIGADVSSAWFDSKISLYLAHLRSTPEFAWARRNSGSPAWGAEVATDLNGNRWVVGSFGPPEAGFGDLTVTNVDQYDGFVVKYDPTGHALWARTIGGLDRQGANSLAVDANGNGYVVGFFEGTVTLGTNTLAAADGAGGYLAKYSPAGDVIWARPINGSWVVNLNRVRVDRGGSVYLAGTFAETVEFEGTSLTSIGFTDAFLAKYSSSGTFQWVRRGGGSGLANATGLAVDGAGNCVLTGSFEEEVAFGSSDLAATASKDVFLVKYDSAGNVKWARSGGGVVDDLAHGAGFDGTGNIYVAGSFSERIEFGDKAAESSASAATFLAKFDRDGAALWVRAAGSTGVENQATGLAVTRDGVAYVCGLFDFELEAGLWRLQSHGGYDGFLLKFNTDGEVQWAKSAGGEGYDVAAGVAVDATGTWSMTGQYAEDATFDLHVLHGDGNSRFFLASSTPILNPRILTPQATEAGLGVEFEVPIGLAAQGNEAGLSFTLSFDPGVLTYVRCTKGAQWSTASTLLLNTNQVASGLLGVGLSRTANPQSGPEEVVAVTFTVPADASARETTIGFADQPVARKAASALSEDLPIECLPSTLRLIRGYEADVVPPFKSVTVADMNRIGSFAMALESIADRDTFERADCAPFSVDGSELLGDDEVNLNDWVQAGRFAVGLDPITVQGGPSGPFERLAGAGRRRDALQRQDDDDAGPRVLRLLAAGWKPGLTNDLVVQFDAAGGENAVSFSLGFDPGLLRHVDTILGAATTDATLMQNLNAASQGRLGVVVLLPFGEALEAGTHELLRVKFGVSPFAEGMTSQLLLGDQPAARDVADAAGVSLTAEYLNAVLDFNPAPLRISEAVLAGGQLQLQAEGANGRTVVIQASPNLGAWLNVATNAPGANTISVPWSAADTARYFRAVATD